MSERMRNGVTAGLVVAMAIAIVALVASFETDSDRVQAIGAKIKCPVCQGEAIVDSPAPMARDMLDLVEERVTAGRSDDQIIEELLESFSGAVLLDPPVSGSTLWLWLAPPLALLIGIGVIVSWRRSPVSNRRPTRPGRVAPLIGLALAFGAIAVVAGFSLQDRDGATSGVAGVDVQDLDDVSNETMEAVIAANLDHPEINGMRLALGERYFELGDFRSAFPHYLEVAESGTATDDEAVAALVRLGWMAWEGNREVDAAVGLFDEALAIDSDSVTARYLKGQVLWCGEGAFAEAAGIFDGLLADSGLPNDSRELVQRDLDAVTAGTACT